MTETILIADNELDIVRFVEVNLRLEGFSVMIATDGEQALEAAFAHRPSLVLLDVMMPKIDGFEVCRRLRADARTSHVPVIILTAKAMTLDKVMGFTAGADDYVLKPFDPTELVARVRTTLRRSGDLRATSPLTGLPGNHRIEQEVARRLADGEEIAVAYADLSDFKAYNDHYGFLRGDQVIVLTAEILREALQRFAAPGSFLGHVGGDDFVMMFEPSATTSVCEYVVDEFDRRVRNLYDPADLERGYVAVPDRQGNLCHYEIVSIAIGVSTNERRRYHDYRGLTVVANEMKTYLKTQTRGSGYAVDGRKSAATA
jgi:diguanylate cyclase (GGDEF)-like protein